MEDFKICQHQDKLDTVERILDEIMIDSDHFKCSCGKIALLEEAFCPSPDPYSTAICCSKCEDDYWKSSEISHNT